MFHSRLNICIQLTCPLISQMAAFPLIYLPSLLLEQVATKVPSFLFFSHPRLQLECSGYFRLQQTCKAMEEQFQVNRNINMKVSSNCSMHVTWNNNQLQLNGASLGR